MMILFILLTMVSLFLLTFYDLKYRQYLYRLKHDYIYCEETKKEDAITILAVSILLGVIYPVGIFVIILIIADILHLRLVQDSMFNYWLQKLDKLFNIDCKCG